MQLTLSQLALLAGCGLTLIVAGLIDAWDAARMRRRERIITRCL